MYLGPTTLYREAMPERLLEEVTDVHTYGVSRDAYIGYTLLNRHRFGEAMPIIEIGGFMSDLASPSRAWAGVQLATQDRPVLQLDLAGHGNSSKLNRHQTIDWCFRRSGELQAEPLLEATLGLIGDQSADYFGYSQGGLLALLMAGKHPDGNVSHVFGLDIPATIRQWTPKLQAGYLFKDGRKGKRKFEEQLRMADHSVPFNEFIELHKTQKHTASVSFARNNPGTVLLNLFMSANARPISLDAIDRVLSSTDTRITLVSGETSSVSNGRAIDSHIASLQPAHRQRILHTIVEGDHNITDARVLPHAIELAKQAFSSLEG